MSNLKNIRFGLPAFIRPYQVVWRVMLWLVLVYMVMTPMASVAFAVPQVEQHELNCGESFSCPPEIQRRVDFWIKVFRSWNTNQVIFHDTDQPERVYSVKTTNATCRRKGAPAVIERERKRIKQQLNTLAAKLQQKEPRFTDVERELLGLFPERDPQSIKRAAKRIRCQQGNRDRFKEALQRYGEYRTHILKVLRESGLSEDILYLPFVESAFNPRAYSRVGAAGLWQIMPRTARKLGLQLNATVDERFDPESATWAAAQYLKNSTRILTEAARSHNPTVTEAEIHPFVITSYNYGVAGMRRAIEKVGPDYVEVLRKYRSRSFRTAVRNFYSSFLAARYVAQNSEKYFGAVATRGVPRRSVVALTRPTSVQRVVDVFAVSESELKDLNPALTRYVWRGWRLIPEGYRLRLPFRADNWRRQVVKLETMQPEQPQWSGRKYVVQRGDTACGIARALDVQCRDLIQLNGLGRKALIRVGQKLDVPGPPAKKTTLAQAKPRKSAPAAKSTSSAAAAAQQTKTVVAAAKPAPERAPTPRGEDKEPAAWRLKTGAPAGGEDTSTGAPEPQAKAAAPVQGHPNETGEHEVFRRLVANIDVAVDRSQVNGKNLFSIEVEPEETLGHYSDWLGIGTTSRIRKLNGIRYGESLVIGRRIKLPVDDTDIVSAFEAKRLEYHRTLVDEFQQHYDVLKLDEYVVKAGDSLWRIAREYELPYWVITRLNPGVTAPAIGQRLAVPVARARKPSKEPPAIDG